MNEFEPTGGKARRSGPGLGALIVPSALSLLALLLLAGPTLRRQVAELALPAWTQWHTTSASHSQAAQAVAPPVLQPSQAAQQQQNNGEDRQQVGERGAGKAAPPVVEDLSAWQQQPGSAFLTPVSRCTVYPDGSVARGPPPSPGQLPFLFNVTPEAVPSKREACSHCPSDEHKCDGPRLPHTCCGVCQFDGRMCGRLYPGEGRSEALVKNATLQGLQLQDFTPCELFQRIRGRTLWLMGDSQSWQFYYAVECFLREFAPSLRRTCPASPPPAKATATDGGPYLQSACSWHMAPACALCVPTWRGRWLRWRCPRSWARCRNSKKTCWCTTLACTITSSMVPPCAPTPAALPPARPPATSKNCASWPNFVLRTLRACRARYGWTPPHNTFQAQATTWANFTPRPACPGPPGRPASPWLGRAACGTQRRRRGWDDWRMPTCAPGTQRCRCGRHTCRQSAHTGATPQPTTCGCMHSTGCYGTH